MAAAERANVAGWVCHWRDMAYFTARGQQPASVTRKAVLAADVYVESWDFGTARRCEIVWGLNIGFGLDQRVRVPGWVMPRSNTHW
jgi:hypothetical protein